MILIVVVGRSTYILIAELDASIISLFKQMWLCLYIWRHLILTIGVIGKVLSSAQTAERCAVKEPPVFGTFGERSTRLWCEISQICPQNISRIFHLKSLIWIIRFWNNDLDINGKTLRGGNFKIMNSRALIKMRKRWGKGKLVIPDWSHGKCMFSSSCWFGKDNIGAKTFTCLVFSVEYGKKCPVWLQKCPVSWSWEFILNSRNVVFFNDCVLTHFNRQSIHFIYISPRFQIEPWNICLNPLSDCKPFDRFNSSHPSVTVDASDWFCVVSFIIFFFGNFIKSASTR